MLKRRNRKLDLPMVGSHASSALDGSGRAISMDAPIIRSAKNASPYTKGSYLWTLGSFVVAIWGWRSIWWHYATTFLSCDGDNCKLKIIKPGRGKEFNLQFHRDQIVNVNHIKVDVNGDIYSSDGGIEMFDSYYITLNQFGKEAAIDLFSEQRRRLANQGEKAITKEQMIEMEKYGSAAMTDPSLREQLEEHSQMTDITSHDREQGNDEHEKLKRYDLPRLDTLNDVAISEGLGQYKLILRKYNIMHKRRRVSALVSKINYYSSGRKSKLIIRENRNVMWQGILSCVFGSFSFLLSLLLGQFWEPEKKKVKKLSVSTTNQARNRRNTSNRTYRPKAYGGYSPRNTQYTY